MSAQIDPRGQRFAATVTTVVLAVVLVSAPTGGISPLSGTLLAAQGLVFAIGAGLGVQHTPYALFFRTIVRPRLGPPRETEDAVPPRFAQGVGLVFVVLALAGYLSGATLLGAIATGFALGAAFLNAAFGFCLGCEGYLLVRRLVPARTSHTTRTTPTDQPATQPAHQPTGTTTRTTTEVSA